eukprot:gene12098-39658_t
MLFTTIFGLPPLFHLAALRAAPRSAMLPAVVWGILFAYASVR